MKDDTHGGEENQRDDSSREPSREPKREPRRSGDGGGNGSRDRRDATVRAERAIAFRTPTLSHFQSYSRIPQVLEECILDALRTRKRLEHTLIHGHPGTGKTLLAQALVRDFAPNRAIEIDARRGTCPESLWHCMQIVGNGGVLVVRHIDELDPMSTRMLEATLEPRLRTPNATLPGAMRKVVERTNPYARRAQDIDRLLADLNDGDDADEADDEDVDVDAVADEETDEVRDVEERDDDGHEGARGDGPDAAGRDRAGRDRGKVDGEGEGRESRSRRAARDERGHRDDPGGSPPDADGDGHANAENEEPASSDDPERDLRDRRRASIRAAQGMQGLPVPRNEADRRRLAHAWRRMPAFTLVATSEEHESIDRALLARIERKVHLRVDAKALRTVLIRSLRARGISIEPDAIPLIEAVLGSVLDATDALVRAIVSRANIEGVATVDAALFRSIAQDDLADIFPSDHFARSLLALHAPQELVRASDAKIAELATRHCWSQGVVREALCTLDRQHFVEQLSRAMALQFREESSGATNPPDKSSELGRGTEAPRDRGGQQRDDATRHDPEDPFSTPTPTSAPTSTPTPAPTQSPAASLGELAHDSDPSPARAIVAGGSHAAPHEDCNNDTTDTTSTVDSTAGKSTADLSHASSTAASTTASTVSRPLSSPVSSPASSIVAKAASITVSTNVSTMVSTAGTGDLTPGESASSAAASTVTTTRIGIQPAHPASTEASKEASIDASIDARIDTSEHTLGEASKPASIDASKVTSASASEEASIGDAIETSTTSATEHASNGATEVPAIESSPGANPESNNPRSHDSNR